MSLWCPRRSKKNVFKLRLNDAIDGESRMGSGIEFGAFTNGCSCGWLNKEGFVG